MDASLTRATELLSRVEEIREGQRLKRFYEKTAYAGHDGGPYKWQVDFHNAGWNNPERMIMAAGRVGKTRTAAAEVAAHARGWYPKWWQGIKFKKAVKIMCASESWLLNRDIIQKELFGDIMEGERRPRGNGWVPADSIVDVKYRQVGLDGVFDTVRVRHVSGKLSEFCFRSYEQGYTKFQGVSMDIVWLDEEPTDYTIYTEALTRVLDRKGRVIFTRTPLFGVTDVVRRFMDGGPGIHTTMASWDLAPHLSDDEKDRLIATYPEHERDTRTKGVPLMGSGGIYPIPDEMIKCQPFPIPGHFRRLCGIDFGIGHKAAGVWVAYDGETDIVYIYDGYSASDHQPLYHAHAIRTRGAHIPVAWPHDGMFREKGSGQKLCDIYRKLGVNMLGISARYDDAKGSGQPTEPIITEILERMRTGRFKVFASFTEWFQEKAMYHRDRVKGEIVKKHDDVMAATNYAMMMLRYARIGGSDPRSLGFSRPATAEFGYDPLAPYLGP